MSISVRLNKDDTELFKSYAKLNNISVSELVRRAVTEKIEDEYDIQVANEAYEEFLKDPETKSLEEFKKELEMI
ncbi:CopG family transcriptional regulator [Peptostreptococcus sp. MV1]|mgnify:CR=1 FL=1|uniref:type II toxin-antitoxin system RelB family antitoxin n=1 Tax=Peptostreptococcus sp. MV1 TaxID=1219626 RepID=UPI00050E60C0|nr:DUF6290 family protein [Peptostreptococcus sp. MV1]KGF13422.1 CopG family transcriptional regulator [Peptostreptococcus sp. MV1]